MIRSPHVQVVVDLNRIRENLRAIRARCGVEILAVVKADAYGLGACEVVEAIKDLVDGFYVFTLEEAAEARIFERTGKRTLAVEPVKRHSVEDYIAQGVQPAVWDVAEATRLKAARPVLSVDTGMQRFACPLDQCDAVIHAGEIAEAFTHGTRPEHSKLLLQSLGGRGLKLHSAASALLDDPVSRLDAIRPGLAMYEGATRISARLVEARDPIGPAGYSGFVLARHGVILAGYSNGLRPGVCVINGTRRRIIEVGMQSAFVELGPTDTVGDEVVLLGDGLTEAAAAGEWHTSPQTLLFHLAGSGPRTYSGT